MAWINNGDKTKGSSGTGLGLSSSDDFLPSEFSVYLYHGLGVTNTSPEIRYFGVSATDYAYRKVGNGGNDSTPTQQTKIQIDNHGSSTDKFGVVYAMNFAGMEKLQISSLVDDGGSGVNDSPNRTFGVGKMDTTTPSGDGQYTSIEFDASSYTLNQYSNLSALGDRGTITADLANIQTNSIFETSDTGKHYIWSGSAWTEVA